MSLRSWFDRVSGRAELRDELKALKSVVGSNATLLQQALAGKVVGMWSSDHFQESKQYSGHVYCAISSILDQIVQATVEPKELNEEKNELYELVHKPNQYESMAEYNERRVLNLMLHGVSVSWIQQNGAGGMLARYSIPTGMLAPTRDGFRVTMSAMAGVTWSEYPVKIFSLLAEIIPYDECQVIRLPNEIHLGDGKSPTSAVAAWIDCANQIDNSRFNLMAKGMRPGTKWTETDMSDMSPEDREGFKRDLKEKLSGTENAGEHLLVPKGLVGEPWSLTSQELDHVNGFTQMQQAVYGGYRVPLVAAGIMEATSHAEFYAAMLQLTELRVQPILWRLAKSDKQVFEEYNFDMPEEFMYRARRVDDPDQKIAKMKAMKEVAAFTDNELRAVLDYPPVPEGNRIPVSVEEERAREISTRFGAGKTDELGTGIESPGQDRSKVGGSNGKK